MFFQACPRADGICCLSTQTISNTLCIQHSLYLLDNEQGRKHFYNSGTIHGMDLHPRAKLMNIKDIRRENLRMLAKSLGGITRLAERLGKTQSQISHLIGSHPIKNIGDKIAQEVESAFKKPTGWLDRDHSKIDTNLQFYMVGDKNHVGELCAQVPLITWQEAKNWHRIAYNYKPNVKQCMVPTTVKVGILAFALPVYGDSMESPTGISFPENAIIIADPDQVPKPNSFVIARIHESRGATFKQLIKKGHQRYLKPLNPRYPILEFTPDTIILGVVQQMVINFNHNGIKNNITQPKPVLTVPIDLLRDEVRQ